MHFFGVTILLGAHGNATETSEAFPMTISLVLPFLLDTFPKL
jgi:hypothetical protein